MARLAHRLHALLPRSTEAVEELQVEVKEEAARSPRAVSAAPLGPPAAEGGAAVNGAVLCAGGCVPLAWLLVLSDIPTTVAIMRRHPALAPLQARAPLTYLA